MSYPDPLESAQLQGSSASDGQQPILTRSPVGPFMPEQVECILHADLLAGRDDRVARDHARVLTFHPTATDFAHFRRFRGLAFTTGCQWLRPLKAP
jgi:hypothetical protein